MPRTSRSSPWGARTTILPGMAWQGYYLDTEGNVFGVHQPDPEAR